MQRAFVLLTGALVLISSSDPEENDKHKIEYVEKYPRSAFVIPLPEWDPQHRSHIDNGWVSGRTPWDLVISGFAPPMPPREKKLPPEDSPTPAPTPTPERYRYPPRWVSFNPIPVVDMCRPNPTCVQPASGPVTGNVRITIQGDFLAKNVSDISNIMVCGVPCVNVTLAPLDSACFDWTPGSGLARYSRPCWYDRCLPFVPFTY